MRKWLSIGLLCAAAVGMWQFCVAAEKGIRSYCQADLQSVSAGCNRCCDDDGSWNRCKTTTVPCQYSDVALPNLGVACNKEGEACYGPLETPPYNAQCEWGDWIGHSCYYLENRGICVQKAVGECLTQGYRNIYGTTTYVCACLNDQPYPEWDLTRIQCGGDACWF